MKTLTDWLTIGKQTNLLLNCRFFPENGWEQDELWNMGWQIHSPTADWRLSGKRRCNSPNFYVIHFLFLNQPLVYTLIKLTVHTEQEAEEAREGTCSSIQQRVSPYQRGPTAGSEGTLCSILSTNCTRTGSWAGDASDQGCWCTALHCRLPYSWISYICYSLSINMARAEHTKPEILYDMKG